MNALAVAIAAGLEAARIVDEERIRQLIREELAKFRPESAALWKTIPAAAREKGRSTKHVRALVKDGLVVTRPRGISGNRVEINMESLEAALRGAGTAEPAKPIDAVAWAARRLGKGAA